MRDSVFVFLGRVLDVPNNQDNVSSSLVVLLTEVTSSDHLR